MNKRIKTLLLALPLVCSLGLASCESANSTTIPAADSGSGEGSSSPIGYDGPSSEGDSSSDDNSSQGGLSENDSGSSEENSGSSEEESGSSDSSTDDDYWENPGDYLGGGGTADYIPSATESTLANEAIEQVGTIPAGATSIPEDAIQITGKYTIANSGNYYVDTDISGKKISVTASGATLYLAGATLSNEKKVIETDPGCDLTITVVDDTTNYISNSNTEGSNAIDCGGTLTINGGGYLNVSATKNAITGESILIRDVTLDITADKDAIHAEIDYDDNESEPAFSYEDGGYVAINDAGINITSVGDGIQADTFVYVCNGSEIGITTNGGAPETITETSSDSGDGKGIKAGPMDWGVDDSEVDTDDYLIYITDDCRIDIDANDDAVHTDGTMVIEGATFDVTAGDDAFHADALLQISGDSANIKIENCYEGIESAKIEISGGYIEVNAVDDGVNAADGTSSSTGWGNTANNNCQLIISGGILAVDANGDGLDSNGSLLIEGGQVYVSGQASGDNAALDADGSIIVNGGYLFACGALGMVETPATNSEQYCVSYARSTAISANTVLCLTDSDANPIFYYNVPKSCQSVIISCPELQLNSTYSIYGGDTELTSFTVTSKITTVGSSTGIGNPGGGPGGSGGPGGGTGRP